MSGNGGGAPMHDVTMVTEDAALFASPDNSSFRFISCLVWNVTDVVNIKSGVDLTEKKKKLV